MTTTIPEPIAIDKVSPDRLERNPQNPRLIFRTDEMEELILSIKENGILVPLTVFGSPTEAKYRILDGERRWIASRQLNLTSIPVNIIPEPTPLQNILMMFNIHALREQWDLLPMALKLGEVIKLTGRQGDRELSRLSGLRPGTVRRCKRILAIPEHYKVKIMDDLRLPAGEREYTEDLFLEVMAAMSVIKSRLPKVIEDLGSENMIAELIEKKIDGVVANTTDYRQISKIVRTIDRGVDLEVVAEAIRKLIRRHELTIWEQYESVAATIYESEAMIRISRQLLDFFEEYDGLANVDPIYQDELYEMLVRLHNKLDISLRTLKLI